MMRDRTRRQRSRTYATGAAVIGGAAVLILLARRWQLRWGATEEETAATVAGDDLIAHPDLTATRAISIRASADRVWPWIAQLGQGRGGFYSYDGLENLVGCDIHSADRIVPEWQDLKVGDQVKLHPEVGLGVAMVEQHRALVLRGGVQMGAVRERYAYLRWWAPVLVEPVEAIDFVMTQRMLYGIRNRAERVRFQRPEPVGCRARARGIRQGARERQE